MGVIKFIQKYDSEISCQELFKKMRDEAGVICKRCGCLDHYWLGTRDRYRCKSCKWETTLRSGTVLEYSKLPYRYWLYAMSFMCSSKKSISAAEMQRIVGHIYYTPVWALMQKIRVVMGSREMSYIRQEFLEPEDLDFEVSDCGKDSIENLRGAFGRTGVSVQAQVIRFGGRYSRASKKFIKLASKANLGEVNRKPEINDVFDISSKRKSEPVVKQWKCARREPEHLRAERRGTLVSGRQAWVNIMLSNAKRNIRCVHHSVSEVYLQNYLNEFCYMTNRRYSDKTKFENLLSLVVGKAWYLPYVQASVDSVRGEGGGEAGL